MCVLPSAAFASLEFPKHCFPGRATLQLPAQGRGLKVDVFSSLLAPWPQALQQIPQLPWEGGGVEKGVFVQEVEGYGAAGVFCPSWSMFKVLAEGNIPTLVSCGYGLEMV